MKVLIATSGYKGFASSTRVAQLIRRGIQEECPDWMVRILLVSDGGEGTVEAMVAAADGEFLALRSFNPLGRRTSVRIGLVRSTRTAVIETAKTAGLGCAANTKWNTIQLSSFGVGRSILGIAKLDVDLVAIGLGGSIQSDGGMGMAQALGVRYYDARGEVLTPTGGRWFSCADLPRVNQIDPSRIPTFVMEKRYTIIADVRVPLLGPQGQARTFGPQKGATSLEVDFIELALAHWNRILTRTFGRNFDEPLAGAAGGLGAGLCAFLCGHLVEGSNFVLDFASFDSACKEADIVITGEGCLDRTTSLGKTAFGVANRCKRTGTPFYGIFGRIREMTPDFVGHALDASMCPEAGECARRR